MKVLRWICPKRTNSALSSPGIMRKTRCCSGHFIRVWKPTRLNWLVREVLLAQLHHRARPPAVRAAQADRLHRPEAQRVSPRRRQLLDRQAALEEERLLEVVQRQHLGVEDRLEEGVVLVAVERPVEVVVARRPCRSATPGRAASCRATRRRRSARWRRRSRGTRSPRSSAAAAAASAGEVSGPVASTTSSPLGRARRPPRGGSRCPGCASRRAVTAAAKRSRSTASAPPAGTAVARAAPMTSEPKRSISRLSSPAACSGSSLRSEFEHTSSARVAGLVRAASSAPAASRGAPPARPAARAARRTRRPRARRRRRAPVRVEVDMACIVAAVSPGQPPFRL